jgi:hypothetical protein
MIFGKTFQEKNERDYLKVEKVAKAKAKEQLALKNDYEKWKTRFAFTPIMIKDGRNVWLQFVFYKKNIELRDGRCTLSSGTMDGYHLTKGEK